MGIPVVQISGCQLAGTKHIVKRYGFDLLDFNFLEAGVSAIMYLFHHQTFKQNAPHLFDGQHLGTEDAQKEYGNPAFHVSQM